jgi:hypothetical protein
MGVTLISFKGSGGNAYGRTGKIIAIQVAYEHIGKT